MSGKNPLPRELAYEGVAAQNPPDIKYSTRAPNTGDFNYKIGTMWVDTLTKSSYQLNGAPAVWVLLGSAAGTGVETLSANDAVPRSPTNHNIQIAGSNVTGVNVTGSGSVLTVAGIASSTTQVGTVELATDAETVTGTDAVRAVTPAGLTARLASPGPIGATARGAGSFTNVSAVATAGFAISATAAAGQPAIRAAADVTLPALHATTGDLIVSLGHAYINGDVCMTDDAYGLRIQDGSAVSTIGTVTLAGLGTAAVLNVNIEADDRIFLTRVTSAGTPGFLTYVIVPETGFTITSSAAALDNDSEVNYLIIGQPALP